MPQSSVFIIVDFGDDSDTIGRLSNSVGGKKSDIKPSTPSDAPVFVVGG